MSYPSGAVPDPPRARQRPSSFPGAPPDRRWNKSLARSNRALLLGIGLAGVFTYGIAVWPYPPKSPTANQIETPGSKAVTKRFVSSGARNDYTPAVATRLGDPEEVVSKRLGEGKKAEEFKQQQKAKQTGVHDFEKYPFSSLWDKTKTKEDKARENPAAVHPNDHGVGYPGTP